MHLSVIDRYVSIEIILSCLSVFFVLLMVVLSVDAVHLLTWLADGRIPGEAVLPLLANSVYEFTAMLVPLSLFLGVLLAFGRLYKDSEMTAIMFAGLGPVDWYRALMIVAVPVTLAMFVLSLFIMPSVADQRDKLMTDINNRTELSTLFAGRFNKSRRGKAIFFLESQSDDGNVMEHVFHRQLREGKGYLDVAQRARKQRGDNGREYMVMENGKHYEGMPGEPQYKIIEYSEYGVYVPGEKKLAGGQSIKAMSSMELWGSDNAQHKAELQWRLTVPVATLILAMIALPLSHTTPRSGKYANLALAILLYLVYSNLLSVGKNWIIKERIPAWIGTWWVHLIALILLFILLDSGRRWFGRRRSGLRRMGRKKPESGHSA
jgi:lipopolysaccharide export system permease protein